jgi:hypothetical protein
MFDHFIKVKLLSNIDPQWHLIFHFNMTIAPTYILNQIELEAKRYGLKHSIANLMDQPSCTLDATIVLKYNSQGRVLLLLVSKQNLKPSSCRIYHTKNRWKKIRNEKVMAPQSKGGQKTQKKNYWGRFLNT